MKVVFFGTPEFALPSLEALHRHPNIDVLGVVTQPDRPVGRKKVMTPPPVKILAEELELKIFQPNDEEELLEDIEDIEADFFIVIAYGMILSQEILDMPKYAAINVHASLLPNYRGASPIHEALLNGDKETGISIMKMDEKLDHGGVYMLRKVTVKEEDDIESLSRKLSYLSGELLPLVLEDIFESGLTPIPQDHAKATYCKKIRKEDGEIDWSKSAMEIMNMLRAYKGWPGIFTDFNGKKLKILEAEIGEENFEPGKFMVEGKILKVGAGKGCLVLKKVQLEGKKPMDVEGFVNGYFN